MHVRRALRDLTAARLLAEVGPLVGDRIYKGRISALRESDELPCLLVDVKASRRAADMGEDDSHMQRAYRVHVMLCERGVEADLAEAGEPSYSDELDDLSVAVETALGRSRVLPDKLGIQLTDWRWMEDASDAKGPLRPGIVALLSHVFVATVIERDGDPTVITV